MNAVLTEHLLHKLFVPLYIFSLTPAPPALSMALVTQNLAAVLNKRVDIDINQHLQELNNPRVSSVVALFLLSLVFLVLTHAPLVHALAWVILNADHTVFKEGAAEVLNAYIVRREAVALGFGQPQESLEEALESSASMSSTASVSGRSEEDDEGAGACGGSSETDERGNVNITDEEKQQLKRHSYAEQQSGAVIMAATTAESGSDSNRPFLDMVLASMDCVENDYMALLSLCLVYAMANNKGEYRERGRIYKMFYQIRFTLQFLAARCVKLKLVGAQCLLHTRLVNVNNSYSQCLSKLGVNAEWLDQMLNKHSSNSAVYKSILIDKLLQIINMSSQSSKCTRRSELCPNSPQTLSSIFRLAAARIRLVTLELSIRLFCQLIQIDSAECCLLDAHHNAAFVARNQSMQALRVFYKSEDIFLDLFEDEYQKMIASALNVEFLCMDSAVLLPPTGTPLTGIEFTRRLPCGEVEKARRAIRVFFLLRRLCQTLTYERETMLPLTQISGCVQVENVLDLSELF